MLNFDIGEIRKKYKNAFVDTLFINNLSFIKDINNYQLYKCPCESNTHFATRRIDGGSTIGDGFASVLHCWELKKQWFLITGNNINRVECIIKGEEEKYFELIRRSVSKIRKYLEKNKIKKINAEHLFVLHATYGYDPTIVEEIVGNIPSPVYNEYLSLIQKHKRVSRVSRRRQVNSQKG